jgi:hypothetical protein
MPMRLSRTVTGLTTIVVVCVLWASVSPATEAPRTQQCQFQGVVVPCTIHAVDRRGVQRIDLGPIDDADWQFDEKDLPRDATALHVELLNKTTIDNARRYALAQFYRLYRAEQARKLLSLVTMQMIEAVKRKYGHEMTHQQVIEAIVLEAGLPVINVPEIAEDIQTLDLMKLLRQTVTPTERR